MRVQVQHAFSSVPRIAGLRRHVLKYLVQTVLLLRHSRRNPQQDSHRRRNRLNTQQGSRRRRNHHSEVIHSTHTIIPTP